MPDRRYAGRVRRVLPNSAAALYTCELLESRTLLNATPDGVIGNTVTIQGTAGNDVITISSHFVLLGMRQFVDWRINDGSTQSAEVTPVDRIFVDTGTGTDEVNVLSTPPVGMTIQGDSPLTDDILNIGGPSGLQGIHGSINVMNTTAFWDITADDTADTTARTGVLSDGSLTGLAPASITWDASKCHGLAIDTSSGGGNSLSVLQTNVKTMIRGHSTGADDSVTVGNATDGLAEIAAGLNVGSGAQMPSGLIHLTLDDQAEPVGATPINYLLDNGQLSKGPFGSETPVPVAWNPGALRSLTVKTQAVPHASTGVVRIESTNVPTTVVSDNPFIEVWVYKDNSTDGILANLYLTNLAGGTGLVVSDSSGHAAGPVVMLHTISVPGDPALYGAIDGMAPGTIAYRYADTASMDLIGAGGDNVNVLATGSNVNRTTVNAVAVAKVAVGDGGMLQNIAGSLDIEDTSVTIDDSADPSPRNVTITFSAPAMSTVATEVGVQGLSPAAINSPTLVGATGSLTINGGTAANAYVVDGPHPAANFSANFGVTLNTGGGNDTVQVLAAAVPLTINGQGGDDAFTINYSDSIKGNLILNGGIGSDTLTIIGPAMDALFSLTHDTITPTTFGTTTYTPIKTLALSTGNFTIADDLGGVNLSTSSLATVHVTMSTHLGTLNIGSTTQVTLAPGLTPLSKTLFCSGLTIAGSGKLDLANNALQLTYSGADPIASIRSYLASGYNNGMWNGNGIVTSAGDATHGLGFGDSADGIVASLAPNTLLVRWTRVGDVNLDGKVGFADLIAVARNYGKTGLNWDQGDMNYDGAVRFDDLIAVARNYGASAAVRAASAMFFAAPLEMPIKTRKRR